MSTGLSVSDGNLIVKVIFVGGGRVTGRDDVAEETDRKRDPSASGCGRPQPNGRDDVRWLGRNDGVY